MSRNRATGEPGGVEVISIRGARQHNLAGVDLDVPTGALVAVTGVSGSGKSSLAFDTLYAEGQRRYVETFSAYARQFLDRMERPDVDEVRGIPPAIAIEQRTRIISSRSTVATLTEMLDHVKVLWERASVLVCDGCGREVVRDRVPDIVDRALAMNRDRPLAVGFTVAKGRGVPAGDMAAALEAQGIRRIRRGREIVPVSAEAVAASRRAVEAVLDRFPAGEATRRRVGDSVEQCLRLSRGKVVLRPLAADGARTTGRGARAFSTALECAECSITYPDPQPSLFSWNSPTGACPECKGFGKVIEIDPGLVIPDGGLTLSDPLVKPWTGKAYRRWAGRMRRWAGERGIPLDVPWEDLGEDRERIWNGGRGFPGIRGFFRKLEKKSYKMHVRVLLSRYRTHVTCPACRGARLRPEALRWRVAGLRVPDMMGLDVERAHEWILKVMESGLDPATSLVLGEMEIKLRTAREVGLGYITLDRDSRTLSGGEVERLGLATALGSHLTRTLYVLDEPSTGLHPRDVDRLLDVLVRLRDRGNTLVVVEHDRRMIRAADRVVDLGPGSGEAGGRVVTSGAPVALMARRDSVTGAYLAGGRSIPVPARRRPVDRRRMLRVQGARARNLAGIDVGVPLGLFVAVTGVSGSGKSTLVEEVIHRGIVRLRGETGPEPGAHDRIEGWAGLGGVLLVDQSPVAGTPRSNIATFTGVFGTIRKLFAATDVARQRGWGPGVFSFNVKGGRCERCQGSGHEKVEMQFLSDLYLVCPECGGRRYREEVLEARIGGQSIADVLDLTVDGAWDLLAEVTGEDPAALRPVRDVGLGYVKLGQPLSHLSGGEAQRVKLAGRLAGPRRRGSLLLLDEPTRGLHPHDVARLVDVLSRLVGEGDSVLVVEHDMDLVKCADWVIDLGPEGGPGGGRVVAAGTPEQITSSHESRTAPFLAEALSGGETALPAVVRDAAPAARRPPPGSIEIRGARENNLDGVDATVPLGRMTVVTGPSGSGKSSLVFDVLHGEGQRRYLDSLSSYARQYLRQVKRADVDAVTAVPPTVAIEQRTSAGGPRSTVATMSEILPYLRLLWARCGTQHCPRCGVPAESATREALLARLREEHAGRTVTVLAPLVRRRKGIHRELAAWASGKGFARMRVDGRMVETSPFPKLDRWKEHDVELVVGRTRRPESAELESLVITALEHGAGTLAVLAGRSRTPAFHSTLGVCPDCGRSFPEPDPRMFSFNSPVGYCRACDGKGLENRGEGPGPCTSCGGERLGPVPRAVRVGDLRLPGALALPVDRVGDVLAGLDLDARAREIAAPVLSEIRSRLGFLVQVGLGYLALDRRASTLSSGESQRIRLAAQLGSNLRGVCYVLDEPTIGLHPADGEALVRVLGRLRDRGNTVVVVEHDEQTIRAADHLIDLGPGAGSKGGRIVAAGPPADVERDPRSLTGRSLAGPPAHPVRGRRPEAQTWIQVRGARAHNLRGFDVAFPVGRLAVVTGRSGSGKSSLVQEVLVRGIRSDGVGVTSSAVEGADAIERVLLVDQSPIGRTSRSTPATYVGFMTDLRRLFASLPEAKARGFGADRFSYNTGAGRCAACSGQGRVKVEMSFLPTMHVPCDACGGRRYEPETLEVLFRGRSIADVLEMDVSSALELLDPVPALRRPLSILEEVGLGYLSLGQPSPTLSGGEAQRLKLASELVRPSGAGSLVVLEEPTTGLATSDVMVLCGVLHRLVDGGATVVVVEHHPDVMAEADWIVDLGPGGGDAGGRLVFAGTPEDLARDPGGSLTAPHVASRL